MTDLTRLSIAEARTGLEARQFSAVELTEAYLGAIEIANPRLNAYVAVTQDKARDMARASDARLAAGALCPGAGSVHRGPRGDLPLSGHL